MLPGCGRLGGNKNTFNVDDVGYASAAAAGLTAGTITPTGASVGTKQGFSIIKWTAPDPQDNSATVPHGLTQKPDFWAVKSLSGSRDWICYTEQVDGSLDFLHFNNTEVVKLTVVPLPQLPLPLVFMEMISILQEKIKSHICGTMFLDYRNSANMKVEAIHMLNWDSDQH